MSDDLWRAKPCPGGDGTRPGCGQAHCMHCVRRHAVEPRLAGTRGGPSRAPSPTSCFTCAASVQLAFQYPWATSLCTAACEKVSTPAGGIGSAVPRQMVSPWLQASRRKQQGPGVCAPLVGRVAGLSGGQVIIALPASCLLRARAAPSPVVLLPSSVTFPFSCCSSPLSCCMVVVALPTCTDRCRPRNAVH